MQILIALLAFAVIGGLFWLIISASAKKNKEAASWPQVPGKVVSSAVQSVRNSEDGGVTFEPNVVYTYSVDGQTFTGNKVHFSAFRSTNKAEPQKTVDKYPAGADVTVRYNPKKPKEAVLEILGKA